MAHRIIIDDLNGPEIGAMIAAHEILMLEQSPPGSCHFLMLDGLRSVDITMWSLWDDGALLGCGALKRLGDGHGEIKSMHTSAAARGQGIGRKMLHHVMREAVSAGMTALWLETGSMDGFIPARHLYETEGFTYCPPFGDYVADDYSVFMTKSLV